MNAPTPRPVTVPEHRSVVLAALIGGAVVSLGLLAGSLVLEWLAAAAVVTALAAGFVAVTAAVRGAREQRERADADARAERGAHRDALQRVHTTQREVLSTVESRTRTLRRELGDTRQEVTRLQGDNDTLRGENEALRSENETLRSDNQTLRDGNEVLRGENEALRAQVADAGRERSGAPAAEVLALPRRRATTPAVPFPDVEAPTVLDLDLARLASPFVEELRRARAN